MRVMFVELLRRGVPAALLYAVQRPEQAAFLTELQASAASAAEQGGVSARVLATATRAGGSAWDGRAGRIDAGMVREAAGGDLAGCDTFICGPTGFMEAAATLLAAEGADPLRIHTESFDY